MQKQKNNHPVTVRFTLADHAQIMQLAEENGSTAADVVRQAWQEKKQRHSLEQQLMNMEQRLKKAQFETLITVTNMDTDARSAALQKLADKGVNF